MSRRRNNCAVWSMFACSCMSSMCLSVNHLSCLSSKHYHVTAILVSIKYFSSAIYLNLLETWQSLLPSIYEKSDSILFVNTVRTYMKCMWKVVLKLVLICFSSVKNTGFTGIFRLWLNNNKCLSPYMITFNGFRKSSAFDLYLYLLVGICTLCGNSGPRVPSVPHTNYLTIIYLT